MKQALDYRVRIAAPIVIAVAAVAIGIIIPNKIHQLGNIAAIWTLLAFTAFVIRNWRTSWRKSLVGVLIMGLAGMFVQVFLYISSVSWLGPFLSADWFRFIVFLQCALFGTLLTIALYRAQRQGKEKSGYLPDS